MNALNHLLRLTIFIFLVLSALAMSQTCFSGEPNNKKPGELSFQKGERLTFQIKWSFIPAGEAILEVIQDDETGAESHHFALTAKTYPAIDIFYKFRERVDSVTNSTVTRSLSYKKLQTGSSQRDITVDFDWLNKTVQYSNFDQKIAPIELQPGTLDPLSSLYFIRQQHILPDTIIERSVTDGKKVVLGRVHFIKKETLSINGTTYETLKLEPELKHVKGVFEKSKNAKMYIWVTNDSRKLLVKLKSKVVVGSFVAELIDYRENLPKKNIDSNT